VSIDFNGSDSRLNLGLNLPYLNGMTAASMMAWVRPDVTSGQHSIMAISIGPPPGTTGTSRFSMRINSGTMQATVRNQDADGASTINGVAVLTPGAWTHVATVYDAVTRRAVIYLNGEVDRIDIAGGATGTAFEATNPKNGAFGSEDDASATDLFNGLIEDVRLYSRLLSQDEIQTIIAAKGADGITTGLQFRFPLNELGTGEVVVNAANLAEFTRRNGAPLGTIVYGDSIIRGSRSQRQRPLAV
jgi:hypothetical protein